MDMLVAMLSEIEEILTGRSMFNIEDGLCWICLAVLYDLEYSKYDPVVRMPNNGQIEDIIRDLKTDIDGKALDERVFLWDMIAIMVRRIYRENMEDKVEDFSDLSSLDIAISLAEGLMEYPSYDERAIIELFRSAFSENNKALYP